MSNPLDVVLDLVGVKCGTIFIAGGAAVDVNKASDIDLWIGNDNRDLADKVFAKLPVKQYGSGVMYDNGSVIGTGFLPDINKLVQVMITPAKNAQELMAGFDISTHCWAYTSHRQTVHIDATTSIIEPPKVLMPKKRTFERYVKICHRYGHPVDILELAKALNC